MHYTHLSQETRYQIQRLHDGGWSLREIGEQVSRDPGTISREIQRHTDDEGYAAKRAHQRSVQRRVAASAQPRIDAAHWPIVEGQLAQGWSPEPIAGRGDVAVSCERIYQYIAADRQRGGTLWTGRRGRKRRRHRCGTPRQRQRFGDGEGDTVLGKGLDRIVTRVERKSGLLRMRHVANGEAASTLRAVVHALYPIRLRVHTLTLGQRPRIRRARVD